MRPHTTHTNISPYEQDEYRLPLEAKQEHTISKVLDWRIRLVLNNCVYCVRMYCICVSVRKELQSACQHFFLSYTSRYSPPHDKNRRYAKLRPPPTIIEVAGVNGERRCDLVRRSIQFRSCRRCLVDNAAFGAALTVREGVRRTLEVR